MSTDHADMPVVSSMLILSPSPFNSITRPQKDMYDLEFVTLWVDPAIVVRSDMTEENLWHARVGAHWGEFVFSRWLNAYREHTVLGPPGKIWGYDQIGWIGSLTHHCLLEHWANEDGQIVRDALVRKKDWREGKHLLGLKTEEEIEDIKVSYVLSSWK